MTQRQSISKKLRFEVFKRDSFKCQYCGASAPDVVLQVDHIKPVASGGDNAIVNLVTSCAPCNAGKGPRHLDDQTEVEKQRRQLEELNERRQQLEMMLQWRNDLRKVDEVSIEAVVDAIRDATDGACGLSLHGLKLANKWIRKYGLSETLDAIEIAMDRYLCYDDTGEPVSESIESALNKVGGVLYNRSLPKDQQRIRHIRNVVLRRASHKAAWQVQQFIDAAYSDGVSLDCIERAARRSGSWAEFQDFIGAEIDRGGE